MNQCWLFQELWFLWKNKILLYVLTLVSLGIKITSEGPDCTRHHIIEAGLQPGGEGTPLYKLYRYVPPHRVGFLRRFGLKTGNHTLCPFWSGIGCGFKGNYGVYERLYRFNSKLVRKKEKYANSKWIE